MSTQPPAPADLPPSPVVRRLVESLPAGRKAGPVFFNGDACIPAKLPAHLDVVLPSAGEERAREWLARGAAHVYLGDAVLQDSTLVERLAVGNAGRIGIYAPAQRMAVSWNLDCHSNADFKVVTPSVCEPCWEILTASGRRTGTHLHWWLGEMFQRGAAGALIRVDIADDNDINILRGLTEAWSERLWIGPLDDARPDYEAWVMQAGAARIVITPPVSDDHPYLASLRAPVPAPARRQASA
jgi:hypothetical protein